MLRLNLSPSAVWIDLPFDVRLLVDPVTSAMWAAAKAGVAQPALPESATTDQQIVALVSPLARIVVRDWTGVGDEAGNAIPVSPEAVTALMDIYVMAQAFSRLHMMPYLLVQAEKKD